MVVDLVNDSYLDYHKKQKDLHNYMNELHLTTSDNLSSQIETYLASHKDINASQPYLEPKRAKYLVSEKGFYGIEKTAQRIVDFILKDKTNHPKKIDLTKSTLIKALKEAESLWGEKYSKISQETINKAIMSLPKE